MFEACFCDTFPIYVVIPLRLVDCLVLCVPCFPMSNICCHNNVCMYFNDNDYRSTVSKVSKACGIDLKCMEFTKYVQILRRIHQGVLPRSPCPGFCHFVSTSTFHERLRDNSLID